MAEKLEIRITGREVVKPSVPTPAHLSRFNLSHLDQLTDDSYFPICWLYSGSRIHRFPAKCRELKSSLAETLSVYYPMAGRIRDRFTVDCCDAGVEFVEAHLNCTMSRVFGFPDPELLKILVPVETAGGPEMKWNRKKDDETFLCAVQATLFECGGVAVSVSITHRIADAATYGAFVKAWAKIATSSGAVAPIPSKGLAQLLPPIVELEKPSMVNNLVSVGNSVTRRFLFTATKIEELKTRASSTAVISRPTSAEAVTALLWKCAVSASRSVNGPSTGKRTAACVAINLRRRLPTILPVNTIGNLLVAGFATYEKGYTDADTNVSDLVVAMRNAVDFVNDRLDLILDPAGKIRSDAKEIISSLSFEVGTAEVMNKMGSDCFYIITSSVSGLIPENLDLGLGPSEGPIHVLSFKNMIALIYTEDGVHAFVTLGKQEMEFFEKDKHLLSFAAPAPISFNNYSTGDITLKSNL